MKQLIICYLGEVCLKGLNKSTFEAQLMKTIRRRIRNLGQFRVYKAQSTIYVEPQDEYSDVDTAYDKIKKIFKDNPIVDRIIIDDMTETPTPDEIKTFWSY